MGLSPNKSSAARLATFGDLIDLHIDDMCAVGKPPRRSKAATLATLKIDLGKEHIGHIDRAMLIEYGRKRAKKGAGPVTLGIDIGVINMTMTHVARRARSRYFLRTSRPRPHCLEAIESDALLSRSFATWTA